MLLIEAKPSNITANELNPDRVAALERIYGAEGATITEGDALSDNAPDRQFDVVIANPPFGNVAEAGEGGIYDRVFTVDDFSTKKIDHAISLYALKKMKDDGRAVLIVGAPIAKSPEAVQNLYRTSRSNIRFYRKLFDEYNVKGLFTIDGSLYKKQGAVAPVNVIVIEGRGGNSTATPPYREAPPILKSWDEVGGLLNAGVYTSEQQIRGRDGDGSQAAPEDARQRPPYGDAGRPDTGFDRPDRSGGSRRDSVGAVVAGRPEDRGSAERGLGSGLENSQTSGTGGLSVRSDQARGLGRRSGDGRSAQVDDAGGLRVPDKGADTGLKAKARVFVYPKTEKAVILLAADGDNIGLANAILDRFPKASLLPVDATADLSRGLIISRRWLDRLGEDFVLIEPDEDLLDAPQDRREEAQG
jgi:hypothetical protein